MSVLNASAVLALICGETEADTVEAVLSGALISSVDLAEVVGTVVDLTAWDAEVPCART